MLHPKIKDLQIDDETWVSLSESERECYNQRTNRRYRSLIIIEMFEVQLQPFLKLRN